MRVQRHDIHPRVINDVAVIIIEEGIPVIEKRDVANFICHGGIIDFNADNADKPFPEINGHISPAGDNDF